MPTVVDVYRRRLRSYVGSCTVLHLLRSQYPNIKQRPKPSTVGGVKRNFVTFGGETPTVVGSILGYISCNPLPIQKYPALQI